MSTHRIAKILRPIDVPVDTRIRDLDSREPLARALGAEGAVR